MTYCQVNQVWRAALWSLDLLAIITRVCGMHWVDQQLTSSTLSQSLSVWNARWSTCLETPLWGSFLNTSTHNYQVGDLQGFIVTVGFCSHWSLICSLSNTFRSEGVWPAQWEESWTFHIFGLYKQHLVEVPLPRSSHPHCPYPNQWAAVHGQWTRWYNWRFQHCCHFLHLGSFWHFPHGDLHPPGAEHPQGGGASAGQGSRHAGYHPDRESQRTHTYCGANQQRLALVPGWQGAQSHVQRTECSFCECLGDDSGPLPAPRPPPKTSHH